MKILKKIGKILGGIFGLLVIVVCVSLIFGGSNKEYYDVENLKDYKTVKIKDAPESFMKILAEMPKNEMIDDGLKILNFANELDLNDNLEKSKKSLKEMVIIGRKYQQKVPNNIFQLINPDFLSEDKEKLQQEEDYYKLQAKFFFGDLVKLAYEERMEYYKSLVEGDQFFAVMKQIGLSELFVEPKYSDRWFVLTSIYNIKSCEPVKLSRAKYLYANINNEPVKVKFDKGEQLNGSIDSMNRIYQVRQTYIDGFRLNNQNLKNALKLKPESEEAKKFITDLTKNYIINGYSWKNKILNDFVMKQIFSPEDMLKLQASLDSIQESNIINNNMLYIDLEYRIVQIGFMSIHNLIMPYAKFDRDVGIVCTVDVYEKEHFYLNNAYELYIDEMRDKDSKKEKIDAQDLKMIKL